MKNKMDSTRDTLRFLKAGIQRVAKDSQKEIDDDRYISVCVEACAGFPVRYEDLLTPRSIAQENTNALP